jgi:putative copper export protein/mono/diheme cytochrome c family protein
LPKVDELNLFLAASRAIHFAAVLLIFGGLVFARVVLGPATRTSQAAVVDVSKRVHGFLRSAGWWGLVVSVLSAVAWLLIEASLMSGQPLAEVSSGSALWLVLTGTGFGQVWIWRLGIAAVLGMLMSVRESAAPDRWSSRVHWVALALAGGYLGSLALVGHAADGNGNERFVRITTDVVHVVAAGAWLGALPGLVSLFTSASRPASGIRVAGHAARRFSTLGMVSVGALLLSGFGNAWHLVGDIPALLGTPYGQLLIVKSLLFAIMVGLAAINRLRLTPQVALRNATALRWLTRSTTLESVVGIGAIVIVGVLGVAVPAAHQSPVWPFSFTLGQVPTEGAGRAGGVLGACIVAFCASAFALALSRTRREQVGWRAASAIVGVLTAALLVSNRLRVEAAYPTSYASPPMKYTTQAIARGAALYRANCVQCHGLEGRGDGPLGAMLPTKPADLVEHVAHHRSGDIYWWIAHGIPNTFMLGFSQRLNDTELWTLVQYLRALSESRREQAISLRADPSRPVMAPDFAFQVSRQRQETLGQLRGREVVLVVGVLPESLPRLQQLESRRAELAKAGIRLVLMATGGTTSVEVADLAKEVLQLAVVDDDTTETYAMFACQVATRCQRSFPTHVEWLVDRGGYLRANWLGVPGPEVDRTAEIMADARYLQRERSRPPQPAHGH